MAAERLRRGSRLGKYLLEKKLGRGSFAEVWRARDTVENRLVALKVALPEVVEEYGRRAIEHEARMVARLDHPNVVAIRNADWIEGRFAMATDLAERSLAQYPGARRSPRIALEVIRQAAAGLAHAHDRRILHRDIKPENILIFADGRAALCDFGVSRFAREPTRTYTEAGTLGYIAPEQAYGRPRLASDVFSLGLIAYELLAGELPSWPFTWPPPAFERFAERVPEPLHPVIRRAAAFDPRRRYPDAVAFSEALERALARVREREAGRRAPRRRRPKPAPVPSPLAVQAALFGRRFGRSLDLRYACYRCEGPIAEAMEFCPWCGASGHSFREVTTYPLVCPECERGVRPEWRYCPWCYAGRFESSGRAPPPDRRAVRRCPRRGCEGELRPFMRYCPMCKAKPRQPWSHPDLPDRCPRCRWPVSRTFWRFCPWCGRREPHAGTFVRTARN